MNRETKSDISKKTIISVAVPEFSHKGYKEASLNRICKNGNISKGRLYHHFKDKDELYLACVEHGYNMLTEHLNEFEIKYKNDIEDVFMDLYRWWQMFWHRHPSCSGIFIDSRRNPPYHLREATVALRRETFIKPLKMILRDIVVYYYPNDAKKQAALSGIFVTLIDYTATVGLSKIDIFDSSASFFKSQETLFNRMLLTMIYGIDSEKVVALY